LAVVAVGLSVVVVRQFVAGGGGGSGGGAGAGAGGGAVVSDAEARMLAEAALAASGEAMKNGRPEQAETLLRNAVGQRPGDQSLRLALAEALTAQRKHSEAFAEMREAMRIGPLAAQMHLDAGTLASQAGLAADAVAQYQAGQALAPQDARFPLYLGMALIRAGERSQATAALVRAVTLNPELAEAWGTLGELALAEDSLGLAKQHLDKARALQPESFKWRLAAARLAVRENNGQAAVDLLLGSPDEQLLAGPTLRVLGQAYGLLGQPAQAAALFTRAADRAGVDGQLRFEAAQWWERAGEAGKAREQAELAAKLGHAAAKDMLGRAGR
jgi:Flp pilus assembly protein TadD